MPETSSSSPFSSTAFTIGNVCSSPMTSPSPSSGPIRIRTLFSTFTFSSTLFPRTAEAAEETLPALSLPVMVTVPALTAASLPSLISAISLLAEVHSISGLISSLVPSSFVPLTLGRPRVSAVYISCSDFSIVNSVMVGYTVTLSVLLTPRFSALITADPTALAVTVAAASSEAVASFTTVTAS
ncbi:hypothetical protein D3C75_655580 [compost metagenome]